jgi:putative nucleotidyltransferase with HDIG domain
MSSDLRENDKAGRVGGTADMAVANTGESSHAPGSAASDRVAHARTGHHSLQVLRPLLSGRRRPVDREGAVEQGKHRRHSPRLLVLSAVALTLALSVVMSIPLLPGSVHIEPGMPAPQDVFAPNFLRYESKVLTEKARQEAMNDPANEVWVQDAGTVQRQRSILLNNLAVLDTVRANETLDREVAYQRLGGLQDINLTRPMMDTLLNMSDSEYSYWRNFGVLPAFDAVMRDRRLSGETEVQAVRNNLPNYLTPALTEEQRAVAVAFISPLIAVNMTLDEEQTRQRREQAAAKVKPVVVTVQKGEAILRQGDLVTPEAIEKMQEAGLLSRNLSPQNVVGTAGIVGMLMMLLHLYIFRHTPHVWQRPRQLLLVGMLLVGTVGIARIFLPGHALLPYMLPVAAVSMLIAVLLNVNLGVLVTFVLSLLLGMVVSGNLSMDLPVYYLIGGLTGIFTLTKIERVSAFAVAGLSISAASFGTVLLLKVLSGSTVDWAGVGLLLLAAAFNGIMSTSLTWAAFSLLGTLFGITTPLQLMELAHPDQPLLRRLMHEAPGTYHHSLVVSNLAERAAEMIGADPLLARVCAFYHDIGKVERPYYFVDNQSGMSNIHDQLDPHVSAHIIAQHVKDGIRLGQKYRLPRKVLDAIPQHHGTMLIKYFYNKALQQDPTTNPDDFRYPGPRPQTKENAILMLADGVEATVRSMAQSGALDRMLVPVPDSDATETPTLYDDTSSLSEQAIARVVHQVITERIEDGQLDECDLTVRDIARIQEAFVSMLKGIYHPRVPYPSMPAIATGPLQYSAGTTLGNGPGRAEPEPDAVNTPVTPLASTLGPAAVHTGEIEPSHDR